jgi:hypothetical protein
LELRLQAWVDGEMSEREAERIAAWVERDAEAGELASQLRAVRKLVIENEPVQPLPETRQFYWSQIERQIQREEAVAVSEPATFSWMARWRQLMISVAGAAALACVLIMAVNQIHRPSFDEISATDQGMEAVTFHDQSAQMTVVWLQDSSQGSAAANHASAATPDDGNSDVELE